jgi:hypothetical protein
MSCKILIGASSEAYTFIVSFMTGEEDGIKGKNPQCKVFSCVNASPRERRKLVMITFAKKNHFQSLHLLAVHQGLLWTELRLSSWNG